MLQRHENVQAISTACCVLHNLLIDMDPRGAQALADVEDPVNHVLRPGAWRREIGMIDLNVRGGPTSHKDGKLIRDYLTSYYNSNAGSVAWQDAMI